MDILTRQQLEDITTCSEHECQECSVRKTRQCMDKAVIAQTALALADMLAKAKDLFDRYAKVYGSIGAESVSEEITALLKSLEGEKCL